MEIRNLMTFVRIAEIQNFSKTAEQLGYSQSAVTMQIKQLETELHAQLFERIGKQVKLTQAGERLLPHALEILNTVRKAERISQEPEQISGKLRIGTCESLVISMLPPVILEMSQLCPHVEISTHTALVPDLFQMLRQNDIDILYFLDEKHDSPEWIKVSERPEKIFFVASAESSLAGQSRIPIERLLEEPLFLTEKGISYRYTMEQLLAAKGYELHPFWEVGNTDVITRFLLKNKGISFLPEYVVHDYLEQGDLVVLDTECNDIIMWSQLAYHRHKYVTPQMNLFLDLMSKHIPPAGTA
ncbi:LysR family transcriptional regulator [Drancourtella sp. An12]|uniref:LysR family transcriptional regulator n=1 Tax=Drancourtella sp. An12 TaxID=1965548 RepID=UPI000B374906|nr:LysR family transcriptional regulator [Drancourtella sp. An12]OUQ43304.1 LysR family transcriptional regulator [Drancourtella sp. An12]